jgi:hypothetical protein
MDAQRQRKELVEKPLRDHLERVGYGFDHLCREAKAWGCEVALHNECGVYTITLLRGEERIDEWMDSLYAYGIDHLARCLRAEMAATGTFPIGTYQQAEAALTGADFRTYRSPEAA